LHEEEFDYLEVNSESFQKGAVADGTKGGLPFFDRDCQYTISIYPSTVFQEAFSSSSPGIITLAVAVIFLFAIFMFCAYDRLVERRQKLIMDKAIQSTAIVSSLFPKNVRDRLMQTPNGIEHEHNAGVTFRNQRLSSLMGKGYEGDNSNPIADLFPHCTVMFADISGFTAWSSTREPCQVFMLLQAIYQAFDKIASKRRVFKVETIGDSCK
jgi:hypothetical protein